MKTTKITHRMNFSPYVKDAIVVLIDRKGVRYRQEFESREMSFRVDAPKTFAMGMLAGARMKGVLEKGVVKRF